MSEKYTLKKLKDYLYEVNVNIPYEDVENERKKLFKEVINTTQVPGFRKGRAPENIVNMYYGKKIDQQTMSHLINDILKEIMEEDGLDILELPELNIDDKTLEKDKEFIHKIEVTVQPKPDIDERYKEIEIPELSDEVTDEDVDNHINTFLDRYATYNVIEKEKTGEEDYVIISFQGYKDDKKIEKTKGEKVLMHIGEGKYLKDFEKAFVGQKINEEFEFKIKFPKDYADEEIAGEKILFKAQIHEIKEKEVPELTDEFVKEKMKINTVAEFKESVKKMMLNDKESSNLNKTKNIVMEELVELYPLDVPEKLVDREIDMMIMDTNMYYARMGYQFKLDKENSDIRNNLSGEAKLRVNAQIILQGIAKKDNITLTNEELEEGITTFARNNFMNVTEVKEAFMKNEDNLVKQQLIEDKVINTLLDKSKRISEKEYEKKIKMRKEK